MEYNQYLTVRTGIEFLCVSDPGVGTDAAIIHEALPLRGEDHLERTRRSPKRCVLTY
jgi:hypothetical protein